MNLSLQERQRGRQLATTLLAAVERMGVRRILLTSVSRGDGKTRLAGLLRGELPFLTRRRVEVMSSEHLGERGPDEVSASLVLVDGPALLEGEEIFHIPQAWMAAFDCSVLVVMKRVTLRGELQEATDWLTAAGAPPLGIVWNERAFPPLRAELERLRERLSRRLIRGGGRHPPAHPAGLSEGTARFRKEEVLGIDEPTQRLDALTGLMRPIGRPGEPPAPPAPRPAPDGAATDSGAALTTLQALEREIDGARPPSLGAEPSAAMLLDATPPPTRLGEGPSHTPALEREAPPTPIPDEIREGEVAAPEPAPPARRRSGAFKVLMSVLGGVVAAFLLGGVLGTSLRHTLDRTETLVDAPMGAEIAGEAPAPRARQPAAAPAHVDEPPSPVDLTVDPALAPAPEGMLTIPAGLVLPGLSARARRIAMDICQAELAGRGTAAWCEEHEFDHDGAGEPVRLSAFYVDRREVPQADYDECRSAGECPVLTRRWDLPEQPVTGVDRAVAETYCAWKGGRLPTFDEYLRAARGETARLFPWGDGPPLDGAGPRANFGAQGISAGVPDSADGHKYPAPVNSFGGRGDSPFGVMNLSGNVREWTESELEGRAVVAGGSWRRPRYRLRVTRRELVPAGERAADLGFRCVKAVRIKVRAPAPDATLEADARPEPDARSDGGPR